MSYLPDKAIHPGKVVSKVIDQEGITQKNLCERMGITEKHLSRIINGEADITVETALRFENTLGGTASFWINLDKNYQETKARIERLNSLKDEIKLIDKFPYGELVERGYIKFSKSMEEKVLNLAKFFGVHSLSYVYKSEAVAFRVRKIKNLKPEHIATWLRCGEIEAKKQNLNEFSESLLKDSLSSLKELSTKEAKVYSNDIIKLLNHAGVGIVYIAHFKGTGVSGAVRWINKNPVIQLSIFNKYADIFWFNLFHEIGHILLHGKKEQFIEYDKADDKDLKEEEANQFAANMLIPLREYNKFLSEAVFNVESIKSFASKLKIHHGIVAGRLCHDKKVHWSDVASLRYRLELE